MEKYNYWKEVANDVYCWMDRDGNPLDISQFSNREEAADWLFDELYTEDSITGNGTFGYATEELCEEYLCHNLDLLIIACDEFDVSWKVAKVHYENKQLARYLDCTIRCYVLMTAIYNALTEREQGGERYMDIS